MQSHVAERTAKFGVTSPRGQCFCWLACFELGASAKRIADENNNLCAMCWRSGKGAGGGLPRAESEALSRASLCSRYNKCCGFSRVECEPRAIKQCVVPGVQIHNLKHSETGAAPKFFYCISRSMVLTTLTVDCRACCVQSLENHSILRARRGGSCFINQQTRYTSPGERSMLFPSVGSPLSPNTFHRSF